MNSILMNNSRDNIIHDEQCWWTVLQWTMNSFFLVERALEKDKKEKKGRKKNYLKTKKNGEGMLDNGGDWDIEKNPKTSIPC